MTKKSLYSTSGERKSELVAITVTDHGEARQWRKGEIVTLKWTHLDRSGEGEFCVVSAKRNRHSAIVEIELEALR